MVVKERMDCWSCCARGEWTVTWTFYGEALRVLVEGIMDAEVSARTSAEYGEREP